MSTKTIKKRIALVAVSALTAGVLSVMSAPASYAAAGNATNVNSNTTSGAPIANDADTAGSVGLLAQDGESTTQTAVMLSTGTLNVFIGAGDIVDAETATATVTGGRFTGVHDNTTDSISGTSSAFATSTPANTALGLLVQPNAGVTQMVISFYSSTLSS
jgi:hypothetical protein